MNLVPDEIPAPKSDLTTAEELLAGYKTSEVTLESGKKFEIESLVPGNLLIDIGSPLLQQFIETPENQPDPPIRVSTDQQQVVYDYVKEIVCEHVLSVPIVNVSQARCAKGVVSIERLSKDEICELFRHIRDLSLADAARFQEIHEDNQNKPDSQTEPAPDSEDV